MLQGKSMTSQNSMEVTAVMSQACQADLSKIQVGFSRMANEAPSPRHETGSKQGYEKERSLNVEEATGLEDERTESGSYASVARNHGPW